MPQDASAHEEHAQYEVIAPAWYSAWGAAKREDTQYKRTEMV